MLNPQIEENSETDKVGDRASVNKDKFLDNPSAIVTF